jgi:hypothetical protein
MIGKRRPREGTGMRQEECIGPGGFTRTKEARGEEAGVVSKEAAGNGRQEAVGATGIAS